MNALNERESDSENFGTRITEIGVTVEKIWLKEVLELNWNFGKVLRTPL
jgi:hypothetical protein